MSFADRARNYKATGGSLPKLPAGQCRAKLVSITYEQSRSGNMMWVLKFLGISPAPYKKRQMRVNFVESNEGMYNAFLALLMDWGADLTGVEDNDGLFPIVEAIEAEINTVVLDISWKNTDDNWPKIKIITDESEIQTPAPVAKAKPVAATKPVAKKAPVVVEEEEYEEEEEVAPPPPKAKVKPKVVTPPAYELDEEEDEEEIDVPVQVKSKTKVPVGKAKRPAPIEEDLDDDLEIEEMPD